MVGSGVTNSEEPSRFFASLYTCQMARGHAIANRIGYTDVPSECNASGGTGTESQEEDQQGRAREGGPPKWGHPLHWSQNEMRSRSFKRDDLPRSDRLLNLNLKRLAWLVVQHSLAFRNLQCPTHKIHQTSQCAQTQGLKAQTARCSNAAT